MAFSTHRVAMVGLVVLGIPSGCATMTAEECRQANWEEVGFNDAGAGHEITRSADHREACAEAGVTVDFNAYREGYALGLPYYCTATQGFETADHGGGYAAQCELEKFPEYADGFDQGVAVYALIRARDGLAATLSDKRDQSEALLDQIADLKVQQQNPDISRDQRRNLRYQQNRLEDLYRDLVADNSQIERRITDLDNEAGALKSRFYGSL